jgi:CRP-like cAMP-binding protein
VAVGDPPDDLYLIDHGEVSVRSRAAGEVRRLGPGEWFGEIGLLRGIPRTMSIIATEDTALLAVPGRVFVDALTGRESLPDPIDRAMSSRLARTHPKLALDRGPGLGNGNR